MNSVISILKEQKKSLYLIKRLSIFQLKSNNNNNYLGMAWEVINPIIQLGIYWFVFGIGIRGGEGIDGVPFVYWLSTGLFAWFFFNTATMDGAKSINSRLNLISKMNFPISAIPSFVILSAFYQHLILGVVLILIFILSGQGLSIHLLQLPYYMFALVSLVFSLTLISSTLTTIVRDIQAGLRSIIRMFLYLTPILWSTDRLPESMRHLVETVLKINPLFYVVEGYRNAFLGNGWFYEDTGYTLYFWIMVITMFIAGAMLHMKFKKNFVDYI
ncbi:teichoic acid ABC transporter permease [Halobacillus litoralis]|uniref:Transport permease protein n=1 Tax=Halobacillus litoralis TaxID=45668 RepID=A0A845DSJ0_9BACI|nr:ABC transporter permease [Halobacillus litoralis]MYL20118.1 teichoic acid ABC transporter permease [Halobacillus litoralis]